MSLATSFQQPRQKPGRSRVVWIGRCAGLSSTSSSGMRPLATAGVAGEAVELLHADFERRAVLGGVVDGDATAGRGVEMRRAAGGRSRRAGCRAAVAEQDSRSAAVMSADGDACRQMRRQRSGSSDVEIGEAVIARGAQECARAQRFWPWPGQVGDALGEQPRGGLEIVRPAPGRRRGPARRRTGGGGRARRRRRRPSRASFPSMMWAAKSVFDILAGRARRRRGCGRWRRCR